MPCRHFRARWRPRGHACRPEDRAGFITLSKYYIFCARRRPCTTSGQDGAVSCSEIQCFWLRGAELDAHCLSFDRGLRPFRMANARQGLSSTVEREAHEIAAPQYFLSSAPILVSPPLPDKMRQRRAPMTPARTSRAAARIELAAVEAASCQSRAAAQIAQQIRKDIF